MLKKFSRKNQDHYQHLISPNAQHTLQRRFLQLFRIKHSTFLAGFLNLVIQHLHLILTPRPMMRLQTSFER